MSKYIKDSIYSEYIKFTNNELKFIDNSAFKRLKNIKQLGSLDHVFPGATHTRFAHSLGVAHLSEKILMNMIYNSKNVKLDSKIIQNVKIAGLLHDLGHGPFSHVFDNLVLKKLCNINNPFREHEYRSKFIFENMVKQLNIKQLSAYDIDFIKNCIDPEEKIDLYTNQIVNNKINSIDVDKFDYLKRDPLHLGLDYGFNYRRLMNKTKIINNKIYFHESVSNDILDLFYTRFKFHKEIYNHKAVKAIELMISDILIEADSLFNFSSIIQTNEFLEMDDSILSRIKYHPDKSYTNNALKIIKNIDNRNLYKEIYRTNISDVNYVKDYMIDHFSDLRENDYHIVKMKFDFCNKNSKALNNIYFYNKNKLIYDVKNTHIFSNNLSEFIISVYKK